MADSAGLFQFMFTTVYDHLKPFLIPGNLIANKEPVAKQEEVTVNETTTSISLTPILTPTATQTPGINIAFDSSSTPVSSDSAVICLYMVLGLLAQ